MADFFTTLSRYTAAGQEPQLTSGELTDILAEFAKADATGALPSDPAWEPTYNMRAAIRRGWKLKLAKAAELQSTDLDGDRMSANQIFEHCERMVRKWGSTASPSTTAATEEEDE